MERVDHVDIGKVDGRCFIGQVDRMIERQVPDREGLELGITGFESSFIVVVHLGKAGCHLAGSGTRSSDDDDLSACFQIFVLAETVVGKNVIDVIRIVLDCIVISDLDLGFLQVLSQLDRFDLFIEMGDDNAADLQIDKIEGIDETQKIL